MYEWLREQGGSLAGAVFAALAALVGWNVKRERQWRAMIEQKLDSAVLKSDLDKELRRLDQSHRGQIAAIKERLDRADRHLDRRFSEMQTMNRDEFRLLREDLRLLSNKLDGRFRSSATGT